MRTISKFMTDKMITVSETADLIFAYELMQKNNIRHLPVLNKKGEITGILSDRDLLRAQNTQVIQVPNFKIEEAKFDPKEDVSEYMSTPVKTFEKDTPIDQVVREMIQDKMSCYLIADGSEVIGIVTYEDFLQLLLQYIAEDEAPVWSLEKVLASPMVQSASNSLSQVGI